MKVSGAGLSRLLERAEARANAAFVEARRRVSPASRAEWIDVDGTYAMFDGPESPCTQTFGLGLFAAPATAQLERIEAFFHERGAPVFHEVSPLADPALLELLTGRGYRPVELSTVLYQELADRAAQPLPPEIEVSIARDRELFARINAEGWSDVPAAAGLMQELAEAMAAREGGVAFLAGQGGEPIAAGALSLHGTVALLAGASTIPRFRNRGAQRALLEARLRYAAAQGFELAMMGAQPGSASQRNAERQGFRVAYTRIKWMLSARLPIERR